MTQIKRYHSEYRIRRISDGLYSSGGAWPKWGKTGKTWTDLRHIKAHLHLVGYPKTVNNPYENHDNFEVVCEHFVTTYDGGHRESLREIQI